MVKPMVVPMRFITLGNVEDVDKAIEKCDLLHLETTGSTCTVLSVPWCGMCWWC
jgi:hypothetical protein